MGIGIGRFCPGKMWFKPLGLGFGHWEWEKMLKIKKWEWDLRIAKWDLGKKTGKWDWYPPFLDVKIINLALNIS